MKGVSVALLVLSATASAAWQFGYIDKTGQLTIPARFEQARAFSEGLAAVKLGDCWGFIDHTGKQVIAPTYDRVTDFHEERAWADSNRFRWLIDRTGRRVCQRSVYLSVSGFHNGRAKAQIGNPDSPSGYLDKEGRVAVDTGQFLKLGEFSGELAWVCVRGRDSLGSLTGDEQTCYIDSSGQVVVQPEVTALWTPPDEDSDLGFFCGRALFQQNFRWGYLDRQGKVAIPARFKKARRFSEGLAVVRDADENGNEFWCYVDTNGTHIEEIDVEPACTAKGVLWPLYALGDFHDGMAGTCASGARKFGFVGLDGKTVLDGCDQVKDFSEGLAAVRVDGKWGFIDRTGKMTIPAQFGIAEPFSEGLAAVSVKQEEEGGGR
jgi:hypothetical protein